MSITSIARSLPDYTLIRGLRGLSPDSEMTVDIPQGNDGPLASADPYFLGCRFHAFLKRMVDSDPLSDQEKLLLPSLNSLRITFRNMGVGKLDPMVRFNGERGIPCGEPDLIANGGPRSKGVIELKVVRTLPDRPVHEHLLQIGAYAAHIALRSRFNHPWASVVYASFHEAKLRFFVFNDTRALVRKSRMLFESAA